MMQTSIYLKKSGSQPDLALKSFPSVTFLTRLGWLLLLLSVPWCARAQSPDTTNTPLLSAPVAVKSAESVNQPASEPVPISTPEPGNASETKANEILVAPSEQAPIPTAELSTAANRTGEPTNEAGLAAPETTPTQSLAIESVNFPATESISPPIQVQMSPPEPKPVPEGCRPLTLKAMAADVKAFTAQSQKLELTDQAQIFDEAIKLWAKAVEQCSGSEKEDAQRNLADSQKVRAGINEKLDSGPQCTASHKNADALQDMARKALGERRWNYASMLFHKSENMWELAAELCSGSQQQLAKQHHDEAAIDGHNAKFCAPLFDAAREQTQKLRSSATVLSREDKQEISMLAETLWREAVNRCQGNMVQDSARNNAQALARERGTPWVPREIPPTLIPETEKANTVLAEVRTIPDVQPTPVTAKPNTVPAAALKVNTAEIKKSNALSAISTTDVASVIPTALAASAITRPPVVSVQTQLVTPLANPTVPAVITPPPVQAPTVQNPPTQFLNPVIVATTTPKRPANTLSITSSTPVFSDKTVQTNSQTPDTHVQTEQIVIPSTADTQPVVFSAEDSAKFSNFSGLCKVVWANGDVFQGAMLNGQFHGKGLFVWANGASYDGDWRYDNPEGQAKLKFANGNQYEGSVINGKPHGQGTMRYSSGDTYAGNFNAGDPDGAGIYTWENGQRFEGIWNNGHPNGLGRTQFPSGDAYTGNYVDGEPDGLGEYNWANGDKHVGNWKAGKMHGQGTFTWKNGNQWTGNYDNGKQVNPDNQIATK